MATNLGFYFERIDFVTPFSDIITAAELMTIKCYKDLKYYGLWIYFA